MIKFNRPFDPRTIQLVIFDLDGTLIDSRLDLVHSVNATLRHMKRPELPDGVIASYVGDGAPALIGRAHGQRGRRRKTGALRPGLRDTVIVYDFVGLAEPAGGRHPARRSAGVLVRAAT